MATVDYRVGWTRAIPDLCRRLKPLAEGGPSHVGGEGRGEVAGGHFSGKPALAHGIAYRTPLQVSTPLLEPQDAALLLRLCRRHAG